jgi:hypothetical protein
LHAGAQPLPAQGPGEGETGRSAQNDGTLATREALQPVSQWQICEYLDINTFPQRTVGLLPFGRSELFLLLLDGKCQQKSSAQPSQPPPPPPPPSFVHQAQVPNCNLTLESLRQPRRARADLLIFGRSHPKEFNQICSSGTNRPAAGGGLFSPVHALSMITSIFLLFHLNSKFFLI